MRTIIGIPEDRLQHLDRWAQSCNISRAEAVRRAVAALLDREASPPVEAGFGLWVQGQPAGYKLPPACDGMRLQQALRDEWPE